MPDPIQPALILIEGLLLLTGDSIHLGLLVLPQLLQLVLVALLVDVALGFYGLQDELFLVGAYSLDVGVGQF